ncbi:MAG: amino acid ABC transporter ATP-binding protein, partial [Lachnospiraceae bacterium]|nr:amino acid ABC transporter ATP-binding protein [Lachnospiraceae bacterium]
PKIIYFDEPTSALDPELTGEILKVIKDLASEKRTMVIVTHEMNFARDVANRIIFVDNGVVVEEGPAYELITNPKMDRTKEFLQKYN